MSRNSVGILSHLSVVRYFPPVLLEKWTWGALLQPNRAQLTRNGSPRVAPHCIETVGTPLGKLSASQSLQLAPATTKSPPEPPAHTVLIYPVSTTTRPGRARSTQNKRPRGASHCIETVGHTSGETIRLPEPPARPDHHIVTP